MKCWKYVYQFSGNTKLERITNLSNAKNKIRAGTIGPEFNHDEIQYRFFKFSYLYLRFEFTNMIQENSHRDAGLLQIKK